MSTSVQSPPASGALRLRRSAAVLARRPVLLIVAGSIAMAFSVTAAAAQASPPATPGGTISTGLIAGTVEDSLATPVAGARVSVVGLGGHGVTNDEGTFRLASVQPGQHVLIVRRIGFRPESLGVTVTAGTISEVRVRLLPTAQWVAPVVIDARTAQYSGFLRGFYERRDRGTGVFFTAEDIEQRNPRLVTDLLRTIPGTRLTPRNGENVVTFRDRNCLPLVWIDGAAANVAYLDPDVFDPLSLAGIEVYKGPSTVPVSLMGLRGKGSCGVIALWTKRVEPKPKTTSKPVTAQDLANLVASLSLYTADQVDVPVGSDEAHPIAPIYPDVLLSTGVPGRVVVEFVVDTTGQPDMNTFGTVTTTHALFTEAVRRAVAAARFTPATLRGQRVLQLVQLPFSFTVPKKQ